MIGIGGMKYIAAARYIRQTLQPATERIEFWKFPHADQAYFPINISGKTFILGRYHICRPLNLTLDIWSNFMKRKKNPFTSIFSCLFLKKGSNSSSFTSFFFILKEEAIFFSLLSLFFCIWPGHPPGYYLESWLWTPALEPNLAEPC